MFVKAISVSGKEAFNELRSLFDIYVRPIIVLLQENARNQKSPYVTSLEWD